MPPLTNSPSPDRTPQWATAVREFSLTVIEASRMVRHVAWTLAVVAGLIKFAL